FEDDFAGAMQQFEASKKILGSKGPLGDLTDFLEAAGKSSPLLKEIGDLVASGDLDGARAKVVQFFEAMKAGSKGLDASQIGITGDAFHQALETIIDGLNALTTAAQTAGAALKQALSDVNTSLELSDVTDPVQQFAGHAQAYAKLG